MAISKKIIKFLEEKKIKYEPLEHRTVYTAFDKAATLKVLPSMVVKTLLLKVDRRHVLVMIGADRILDEKKFKKTVNTWLKESGQKPIKSIQFGKENWMKKNLKGIKVGTVPPFGEIWKLVTFVDKSLLRNKKLIVNGGDYNFSIKLSPAQLKKVENLIAGSFSKKKPKKRTRKKKVKRSKTNLKTKKTVKKKTKAKRTKRKSTRK